jgi:hypothetical protein
MNSFYIAYNIFICALCIVSSYYYASYIGFRYALDGHEEASRRMVTSMIIFESFFFVHFLLQFILEYQIEGYQPVRDIAKIAKNYIYKGSFLIDFICLLPLTVIKLKRNRQLLFFIVKLIRLMKGFTLLDVQKLMSFLKKR